MSVRGFGITESLTSPSWWYLHCAAYVIFSFVGFCLSHALLIVTGCWLPDHVDSVEWYGGGSLLVTSATSICFYSLSNWYWCWLDVLVMWKAFGLAAAIGSSHFPGKKSVVDVGRRRPPTLFIHGDCWLLHGIRDVLLVANNFVYEWAFGEIAQESWQMHFLAAMAVFGNCICVFCPAMLGWQEREQFCFYIWLPYVMEGPMCLCVTLMCDL